MSVAIYIIAFSIFLLILIILMVFRRANNRLRAIHRNQCEKHKEHIAMHERQISLRNGRLQAYDFLTPELNNVLVKQLLPTSLYG